MKSASFTLLYLSLIISLSKDLHFESCHLVTKDFQNFALFNTQILSFPTDKCVSQKFDFLHVELGGETQGTEVGFDTVTVVGQSFLTLL